ncbi:MAG TPA: YggT family protein [Microbacteriaceae bacterium]|nr:YggT family protein [Microbacteriaceae bacterium]
MVVVHIVLRVIHVLLIIYLILLWARIILELVRAINRQWRPRGAVLVIAEIIYTLTDPPIRLVRKVIPPIRLGPVAIDLSVMLLMFAVIVLMSIVGTFLAIG